MTNSLFGSDGKPDINRIANAFPQQGSGRIDHRTSEGHNFAFEIAQRGGGYEAVILSQPGYGSRANSLHDTHRLPGPSGHAKVCFATQPQDLPTAIAVTMWWAECTSKYINNGRSWK